MAEITIQKGRVEQEAEAMLADLRLSFHSAMEMSIAISLKRIADVLEGSPQEYGIKNLISDISQNISNRG